MVSYSEPAVTEFIYSGVHVRVLHEYQNHSAISGNKWWKLKGNLEQAKREGCHTLLTFGGAYSNHIYATAAAANAEGFKSIGIIRGEEVDNPVLAFARGQGMELRFVSRAEYQGTRRRRAPMDKDENENTAGVFVIAEGGTNQYAVEACAEWGVKLLKISFDQIYLAVGTGGTMSGLVVGLKGEREVVGVSVLKNTGFLEEEVERLADVARGSAKTRASDITERSMAGRREAEDTRRNPKRNWRLLNEYHFGGYAKTSKELLDFCGMMKTEYNLTVEPVYTGKLFRAVFDQIEKGLIKTGTTILVIHTGGIQLMGS